MWKCSPTRTLFHGLRFSVPFCSYEKDVSSSTPVIPGFPRHPPPSVFTILSEELSDRDEQFSVESIEELDNSAQETALRKLDASMSSQDLHIGLINADEFNDIQNSIIDWEDDSWCPDKDTESVSSLEEDETREVDSNSANSEDEDYVPRLCADWSVHQLAKYLVLPVNMCTAKEPTTNFECRAPGPFEVSVKSRGTAAIVEWMCLHGHTVWKGCSQPTLKRCSVDSPGFCAQYCTYTAMDNDSKNIICMINIDKRETQRNAVIMEKEGFVRTVNTLREELHVTEMCTDAHTQISALFSKGDLKDSGIHHSLDIWHGSKNVGKKVLTAGQQKGCSILQMWNKDICNHFWYCCKTAHHYEDFFNVHTYLRFRSTADLESFNNHILMYASKRFSFSPTVYAARTLLAGLDYNHHIHRPAKRKRDGSIQYVVHYLIGA
ncbi:hypothetical protein KUCAC02_028766 [Chaenocephalus aceratus]|uniref:Uncharacterized protein n=1 Tax=Chaenocephalus aceratus TaxID=36190 RepID=A0ACB9X3E4_CHAAC|nr:hypothetical protein KUCAC02_028766 [Chaenocephalus aceratus]